MSEANVAVIAAAETERAEEAGDTAVELAKIAADVAEVHADAAVEIAEVQADAAVEIAQAEAEGNEEWRTEVSLLKLQMSDMAQAQATMAESIALLAQSTLTPPSPEPMLEVIAETLPAEADGPRESPEAASPEPEPARVGRVRRWM